MLYQPQDVAAQLGVSSPTLRLWSSNFADDLSPYARKSAPTGRAAAQRRYTDDDVARLLHIKSLLRQGLTFDQVKQRLREPMLEVRPAGRVIEQPLVQALSTNLPGEQFQPSDPAVAEQLNS